MSQATEVSWCFVSLAELVWCRQERALTGFSSGRFCATWVSVFAHPTPLRHAQDPLRYNNNSKILSRGTGRGFGGLSAGFAVGSPGFYPRHHMVHQALRTYLGELLSVAKCGIKVNKRKSPKYCGFREEAWKQQLN